MTTLLSWHLAVPGGQPSDPADPSGDTPWPWPNLPPHPSVAMLRSQPAPTGDDMPVPPDPGGSPKGFTRWVLRAAIVAAGVVTAQVFLWFANTPPLYALAAVIVLVSYAATPGPKTRRPRVPAAVRVPLPWGTAGETRSEGPAAIFPRIRSRGMRRRWPVWHRPAGVG